jgi:phage tail sheath gpL-like
MPVSFSNIPSGYDSWRQPLYWVEVDNSMAGFPISHMRSLLVGMMISTTPSPPNANVVPGIGTPDVPIPVGRQIDADRLFGQGSELACMFRAYFANNRANELWCVPVAEPSGSTHATGTITVLTPPVEAGQISLYIAGYPIRINVSATATVNDVAANIASAINAALEQQKELPVTATATAAIVTITAKFKGINGNMISMRDSYYGKIGGEELPVGLTLQYQSTTASYTCTVAAVAAGGNGYVVNDTITLVSGVVLTVATLTGSAVATATITNAGSLTGTPPVNPIAQVSSSGAGQGATFNLTWTAGTGTTAPSLYLAGGAGIPDFTNAIANLGETEFEYVALPYQDSTTLANWTYEYGFSDGGRWGWLRQHFGGIYSAVKGKTVATTPAGGSGYSDLVTWGIDVDLPGHNSPVYSTLGIENTSPSPEYEWCAAYVGKASRALSNDPARPLQTLHLETILPAPHHDLFNLMELNTLAYSGIATQRTLVASDGPMISRESTMYQLNNYGFGDDSYELVTTLCTLAAVIRNQRQAITSKYPRHKLADDDTRFGPGQAIVTPKIIKAELIAEYAVDEFNGLVENLRAFKDNLIVERDSLDPNRVNVLYPPDLINQLRMFAVLAQFRLQYNRGIDAASLA